MKTFKIIGWYFAVSFLVWLILTAGYGAASTDVSQSLLYNTRESEERAMFVHFPIFALLWPIWALLGFGLLVWLPDKVRISPRKVLR